MLYVGAVTEMLFVASLGSSSESSLTRFRSIISPPEGVLNSRLNTISTAAPGGALRLAEIRYSSVEYPDGTYE